MAHAFMTVGEKASDRAVMEESQPAEKQAVAQELREVEGACLKPEAAPNAATPPAAAVVAAHTKASDL